MKLSKQELGYLLDYLRGQGMTYAEYLNTPHWQEVREKRLSMPFCFCSVCGYTKNLNVHHNTYERIGREAMKDLVILCWKHHRETHELIDRTGCSMPDAVNALIDKAREERRQSKPKKKRGRKCHSQT